MIERVRAATTADAIAIAEIEAAVGSTSWSADAIRSTLEQPTSRAWVAEDGGATVGHLITTVVADEGELLTIAVRENQRRRGRASALLRCGESTWRASGVREAFAEVRAGNAGALHFYRGRGWEEIGRRRGYYADGEDAILMRWRADC